MLRTYFWTLVVVTCGFCHTHVIADPTQGAPTAPPGPTAQLQIDFGAEIKRADMLILPEVTDALNLNVEQRREVADVGAGLPQTRRTASRSPEQAAPAHPRDESPETQVMRELLNRRTQDEVTRELTRETSRLVETLDREQMQRLNQVYVRFLDGQALGDTVVAQLLELTQNQRSQINHLREEAAHKFLGHLHSYITKAGGSSDGGLRKAYGEIVAASGKQMLALLSPEQLASLETIKGEPLPLSEKSTQMMLELSTSRYLSFVSKTEAIRPNLGEAPE